MRVAHVSASSGAFTPPGTVQDGCTRSLASPSITCWPNLRSAMPSRASSGMLLEHADHVALGGIGIHAQQQVRRGEMEEAERVRLHELPAVQQLAQLARRSPGICTAMMASQALTDASRWLTGQMPQMRAVIEGIS